MQIKTSKLQEMMSKAIKGVGNNKLIPLTSLMALSVKDGRLTITTTDATNYLYVSEAVDGDDFYVCVQADVLYKLISKMTSDEVTLTVTDNSLEVKGNGKYNIALPADEDGSIVKYPNPLADLTDIEKVGSLSVATIKSILNSVKPGLASSNTKFVQYLNYYVGDCVMATDTFKVNILDSTVVNKPMLISAEMMNLLEVMTDEVEIRAKNNQLVMTTPNCTICGYSMNGLETFSVDAIKSLTQIPFASHCKVSKADMLQLLDRIALFVDNFDDGAIQLTFTKDGILVENKQSSGTELIPYIEVADFAEYNVAIDIYMLQSQIKAQTTDAVEIWFGDTKTVKFVDGDITMIIALLED